LFPTANEEKQMSVSRHVLIRRLMIEVTDIEKLMIEVTDIEKRYWLIPASRITALWKYLM